MQLLRPVCRVAELGSLDRIIAMPLFAYSGGWYPSLNPVGSWSAIALGIASSVWLLVEVCFRHSKRSREWLTAVAPLALLGFVFHSKIRVGASSWFFDYWWGSRRFPNAQDYFADYIFTAVALILAWKAARISALDLRVLGMIDFVLALTFLGLEFGLLYRRFYAV